MFQLKMHLFSDSIVMQKENMINTELGHHYPLYSFENGRKKKKNNSVNVIIFLIGD